MIPHFKEHTHIYTDKQHFDIKQASMIVQEKEPLSPREVLWNLIQRKSKKNVSIVNSTSYDTFLLYIIVLPEYVESTQILPKDSPMATIWLHFFL